MVLPQLIAGNADLRHRTVSVPRFNSCISHTSEKEPGMTMQSRSAPFDRRRVMLDMLGLALQGTAAAVAVAALALGLIALIAR